MSDDEQWMETMDKCPMERSEEDIAATMEYLQSLQVFKNLNLNLIRQLARYGYYEKLDKNITLFRQGDVGTNWYTIISGCVEAKRTINNNDEENDNTAEKEAAEGSVCMLRIGNSFGESVLDGSPRDATVSTKEACQLIRVEQKHFKLIYQQNKKQVEETFLSLNPLRHQPSKDIKQIKDQRYLSTGILHCIQRSPSVCLWNGRHPVQHNPSAWVQMQDMSISYSAMPITHQPSENTLRCGHVLRTLMLSHGNLIRDRKYHMKTYHRCMVGVEMVDWLLQLKGIVRTRTQALMAWQSLLEEGIISHVSYESHFQDKYLFYRFHNDVIGPIVSHQETTSVNSDQVAEAQADIAYVLSILLQTGPDALLRMILRKQPYERTADDLETIYDELRHIKALSHLSTSVKKELSAVLAFEVHHHKGTILFHQGDEGRLWYIIIKGSVDVVIHGKGTVCSLTEGDDFGKLALVNDAPRAATIVTTQDNCQFLSVDKDDFNRILKDVEANTVRLKEHGQDVLILQNVLMMSINDKSQRHRFLIIAGTPQKILEHLLETCVNVESNNIDSIDRSVEDYLFTHVVFMPYQQLCTEFMKFYLIESSNPTQDHDFVLNFKRKVIHFLHNWTFLIGDAAFQDETFISLIEDMTKVVRADHMSYGHLQGALETVLDISNEYQNYQNRQKIRKVWEVLSNGHITQAIEDSNGGATVDNNIKRPPITINDQCVFKVYCADHTYCTLKMQMTVTADEVKRNAADKMGIPQEGILLVEVKSNREKVVFQDEDFGFQTNLSVNSRLFIIPKEHLDALTPLSEQDGPNQPMLSTMEDYSSKEIAYCITAIDWELFNCIHEYELLYHSFGREQLSCNLDIFLHRFNLIQLWPTTEICLTKSLNKRTQLLKKFIKIAQHCYELQNLSAFLAIVMGLGNSAVIRLTQTWEKLAGKCKKLFSDFESLLDPSRNHRIYRVTVSKMNPPLIPLVPLLIKDLLFSHEGNKTYLDGLVNFEKMAALTCRIFKDN
ncbi:Rap guanine nucleotide exchange factor 4, variant 2 [Chamberlinius hualienensis]